MFRHDRNSRKAAILLLTVIIIGAAICIFQVGIGQIFSSFIGGLINLAVGAVVLTALYGIFNDGFDSGGSSPDSSDDEPRRRDTASDACCNNCVYLSDLGNLCTKFNRPTGLSGHCRHHIWG